MGSGDQEQDVPDIERCCPLSFPKNIPNKWKIWCVYYESWNFHTMMSRILQAFILGRTTISHNLLIQFSCSSVKCNNINIKFMIVIPMSIKPKSQKVFQFSL